MLFFSENHFSVSPQHFCLLLIWMSKFNLRVAMFPLTFWLLSCSLLAFLSFFCFQFQSQLIFAFPDSCLYTLFLNPSHPPFFHCCVQYLKCLLRREASFKTSVLIPVPHILHSQTYSTQAHKCTEKPPWRLYAATVLTVWLNSFSCLTPALTVHSVHFLSGLIFHFVSYMFALHFTWYLLCPPLPCTYLPTNPHVTPCPLAWPHSQSTHPKNPSRHPITSLSQGCHSCHKMCTPPHGVKSFMADCYIWFPIPLFISSALLQQIWNTTFMRSRRQEIRIVSVFPAQT